MRQAPDHLRIVGQEACAVLATEALGDLGLAESGICVLQGANSWGAHRTGVVDAPFPEGRRTFSVAYDANGAPYVTRPDGSEDERTLISLADEGDCLACAWARMPGTSKVLGIGIDLVSTEDLDDDPRRLRYRTLLFSEREMRLATECGDDAVAYATLFGAKEAAFKALARPLRLWRRDHQEELLFEVRNFSATAIGDERGTERDAAAQGAMDVMGVRRISWRSAAIGDKVLVVAMALD